MKKYGKFVCGALRVPQNYPSYIELDGQKVYNPTDEQYAASGYLPIEETEPETPAEGKMPVAHYAISEDGTKIVQSWTYEDIPVMETEQETEAPKKTTKKKSTK